MKLSKKIVLLSALTVVMFALSACQKDKNNNNDKLTIVTTLFPDYDFAKQIVGDKGDVSLLLDPGVEAHDFDPTPSDIISINKADLFIYTGKYMETWAPNIIDSLESDSVTVVDASKGIELIKTEDDVHEEEEGAAHDHEYDPHIWTSPKNAITMINTILEAIIKEDPDNEKYYRENATAYIAQIQDLDTEFAEIAANAKYNTIYFGGRFALVYFVKEYGLSYMAAFDSCSSETEPSAKLVTQIVDAMKQNGANVVYYEELTDPKSANAIADELGGTTLLLHSCHNVSSTDFKNGVTYVSLMKQNAENLKAGLGEEQETK
jgi:zinc transport system substrate-binding protein